MALNHLTHDPARDQSMTFTNGGMEQSANYTWYRGPNCNFGPTKSHLAHWTGYRDYFLKGLVPDERPIGPETRITAFGSCFAANISSWLAKREYQVLNKAESSTAYIVRSGEGFVNTYSILQQFEWAFEGKQPSTELWHGYDAEAFGYDEAVRQDTAAIFAATDVFILTFGLSEVWYDRETEEVFWRAVPLNNFDPERHGFRTVSVEENRRNIARTVELIRRHRPEAKIIVTLSPIPLVATFRNIACSSANAISKASLRCAIDQVLADDAGSEDLFYWPSYEIVVDGFVDKWADDRRHVHKAILGFIMRLFEEHWCRGGLPEQELSRALIRAKISDGTMSADLARRVKAEGDPDETEARLAKLASRSGVDEGTLATLRGAYGKVPGAADAGAAVAA